MKAIMLGGRNVALQGLSTDDPYFRQLADGAEAPFAELCAKYVGLGSTALDIGANIGVTSLILSSAVGPTGRVIAAEPGPAIFDILSANLELNGASNVEPKRCAVGAHVGSVRFLEASAYGHILDDHAAGIEVPMSTVDKLAADAELTRLNMIKVDVEGYESGVLKGASRCLAEFKPIIMVEYNLWCLIAFSKENPLDFMLFLSLQFPFLYILCQPPRYEALLNILPPSEILKFVHDSVVDQGAVYNIVGAFEPLT